MTGRAATPAAPAVGRDGGLLCVDAALSAAVALLLPLAFLGVGLAQLNRSVYPLAAFAAAAYLYNRSSSWYPGLCVWLFAASPLVRRMTDEQLGFEPSSTVLLAPYLACLCAAWSCLSYCLRPRPVLAGPFIAMLACLVYGFALAVLGGRLASGMVDLLKWSVGPLMAVHLLATADRHEAMQQVLLRAFVAAGIAMSVYGIAQFVSPPTWDAEWLRNMILQGMTSSGRPEPYEIRVFSTMHSAGSFGAFLTVAFVLLLALPTPVALPGLAVVGAGLALCQYRAIWAGTALAVLCVVLAAPGRVRLRVILGVAAVVIGLSGAATVPEIEDTLASRFRSLTELKGDASGEDRLNQYGRFLDTSEDLLTGAGLAINGGARRLDNLSAALIDSGLLETLTALGVVIGAVYFWGFFLVVWRACTVPRSRCPQVHLYRAIVAGWIVQLPFGSVHLGEIGFGMWPFIGLSLAAGVARDAPANAVRLRPTTPWRTPS